MNENKKIFTLVHCSYLDPIQATYIFHTLTLFKNITNNSSVPVDAVL
jgi:hypothetical protein